MFGRGFRAFSRLPRHLYRASPVFCAAVLVTIPPERRKERFQGSLATLVGFGSFFVPKVPIPDLSILKKPLFKLSDDGERTSPFVNGNPQADIIVGLDVGPMSTQAVVVFFPKGSKFPDEKPDSAVRLLNDYFPNSMMVLVTWPRPALDGTGMFDAQGIETGVVLSSAPGGKLIEKIGIPGLPLDENNPGWKRFVPGFHFLTTTFINEELKEAHKCTCEDVLTAYLRGVRQHIEEFIEQNIVPIAFTSGEKPKIKWLVSTVDGYDRTADNYEPKRTFWEALRSAGYPVGDGTNDAGMWDPYMLDGTRQKGDPFHVQLDRERAASMVELVSRGLMASYFAIATHPPEQRLNEGTLLLVMDDTVMGFMSRLFKVDHDERFAMIEYREMAMTDPMTDKDLRLACYIAAKGRLKEMEGMPPDLIDKMTNREDPYLWNLVEDVFIEYATDWATGGELPDEVTLSIVLDDGDDSEDAVFPITFTKSDMEFVLGFGLVTPFLIHLDYMFSLAETASVAELQNIIIVNDLTNHGDMLGKVFSKVVSMLKDLERQPSILTTQTSPPQQVSAEDDEKEDENEPSLFAEMEIINALGIDGAYRITSAGNPIEELSSLVRQLPNLADRSFADFKVHYEDGSEMVFVGMTAACSDELNRMYLKALGWNAGSRAYLQIDRGDNG